MSDSYQEQHPLLYEDLSDEDQFSPRSQRRLRPMVLKTRVRNKVKGAAAIIRLWPEHCSTSVAYWWMVIGMIGLITFVVYNIVASLALLPPPPFKELHMRTLNDPAKSSTDSSQLPFNVYMHLFVEKDKEVDLNNYLPYIEIIASKYPDSKYHLLLVLNDTTAETNVLSAEENNENALNALWARTSVHRSPKNNIYIEHVTLSKYMDKSPLKNYWRKLPKQFIEFLTRAVSIWDKGGISFNPTILTPRSPHPIYIEKLQNILKNFNHVSKKSTKEQKVFKKHHDVLKKKVNNIRDIIDALEHDDSEIILPYNEVDSNLKKSDNVELKQPHLDESKAHHSRHQGPKLGKEIKNMTSIDVIKVSDFQDPLVMAESKIANDSFPISENHKNASSGILPMFLEFLFRNNVNSTLKSDNAENLTNLSRKRKHVIMPDSENENRSSNQEKTSVNHTREVGRVIKSISNVSKPVHDNDNVIETQKDLTKNMNQLTIDLKGNILSSEISCHAFLGTMFSNAFHSKQQESLTDFIIAELSIFCKGVLSSCTGIDVILL